MLVIMRRATLLTTLVLFVQVVFADTPDMDIPRAVVEESVAKGELSAEDAQYLSVVGGVAASPGTIQRIDQILEKCRGNADIAPKLRLRKATVYKECGDRKGAVECFQQWLKDYSANKQCHDVRIAIFEQLALTKEDLAAAQRLNVAREIMQAASRDLDENSNDSIQLHLIYTSFLNMLSGEIANQWAESGEGQAFPEQTRERMKFQKRQQLLNEAIGILEKQRAIINSVRGKSATDSRSQNIVKG